MGGYRGGGSLPVNGLTAYQSQVGASSSSGSTALPAEAPLCDTVWFLLTQVLNLIKSCHVPEGMSLQDLKQQLHSMSMPTIK